MIKWKYRAISFLLLAFLASALPCVGEQMSGEQRSYPRNREIHDLVETIREEQLLRELQLNAERVDPVLENIRSSQQVKNSYLLQKYLIENELDALLNYPSPNQEEISEALKKLELSRFYYYQALLRNEQELRELLTPEEQARYVLFQRQFNRRLKELIVKIRRQGITSAEPSNQILRRKPQESVIRKPH